MYQRGASQRTPRSTTEEKRLQLPSSVSPKAAPSRAATTTRPRCCVARATKSPHRQSREEPAAPCARATRGRRRAAQRPHNVNHARRSRQPIAGESAPDKQTRDAAATTWTNRDPARCRGGDLSPPCFPSRRARPSRTRHRCCYRKGATDARSPLIHLTRSDEA